MHDSDSSCSNISNADSGRGLSEESENSTSGPQSSPLSAATILGPSTVAYAAIGQPVRPVSSMSDALSPQFNKEQYFLSTNENFLDSQKTRPVMGTGPLTRKRYPLIPSCPKTDQKNNCYEKRLSLDKPRVTFSDEDLVYDNQLNDTNTTRDSDVILNVYDEIYKTSTPLKNTNNCNNLCDSDTDSVYKNDNTDVRQQRIAKLVRERYQACVKEMVGVGPNYSTDHDETLEYPSELIVDGSSCYSSLDDLDRASVSTTSGSYFLNLSEFDESLEHEV